jgi:PKD repeat protein
MKSNPLTLCLLCALFSCFNGYSQTAYFYSSIQKISSTKGNGPSLNSGDNFGTSVAGIGDINGDGVPDIGVGVPNDNDGGSREGAVYILFMKSDGTVKSNQKISQKYGNLGVSFPQSSTYLFGFGLVGIGDLNGDGYNDIAVGSLLDNNTGAVWILFLDQYGKVKSTQRITNSTGGFTGNVGSGDQFGKYITYLGDYNNDGYPDIAVCDHRNDDGGTDIGAMYILSLNTNGTVKYTKKIGANSGNLSGLHIGDQFGNSIASLGDIDGDGIGDIAVGAIYDDEGTTDAGAVYILCLKADGTVKHQFKISSISGHLNQSLPSGTAFGNSLNSPGDLNHDGTPDLLVGANLDNDGGSKRGAFYMLLLKTYINSKGDTAVMVKYSQKISSNNFSGTINDNDYFGNYIDDVGDINNDGRNDVIVGAALSDDGAVDAGAAWLLFTNPDYQLNDLGLTALKPIADTLCSDTAMHATITVSNKGDSALTKYGIQYRVIGDTAFTKVIYYNDTLATGKTHTLNVYIPVRKGGRFYVYATQYVPNDTNSLNDLSKSYFYVSGQKAAFKTNNVCQGDSVYFVNTSTSVFNNIKSYSWDFGDNATSTLVSPAHFYVNPGTYKVTLTVVTTLGCTAKNSANVSVYPKPSPKFSAAPVCIGDSMRFSNESNLSDSLLSSVKWNFGDSATSVKTAPVHFYSKADSFKVTLSLTTINGCSASYSKYVHVNQLPKAVFTTATSTCQMDSLSFANSSTGADSYSWTIDGAQISSAKTTGYHFTKAGTFIIGLKVTNSSGCYDSVSQKITIYPKPYARFTSTNVCLGEQVSFKDSVSVAGNEILTGEHWTFGDGDGDKGPNPVHTYTKAGEYAVQLLVSSSNDCSTLYTDTVIVYALPNEKYKRTGDSLYVSQTYSKYQWYRNDSAITGATQFYYIVRSKGKYTVLLTNKNGCIDSAASTYEATSIASFDAPVVEIFPNPGTGIFTIKTIQNLVHPIFRVYDAGGKKLQEGTLLNLGKAQAQLNIEGLPAGIYQLLIIDGEMLYSAKIMISGK